MSNIQKIIISVIIGSFWGLISNLILGIFIILLIGTTIQFNYLSFLIVSSISSLIITFYNKKNLQTNVSIFLLTFILILIFTGISPYGLAIDQNSFLQIVKIF